MNFSLENGIRLGDMSLADRCISPLNSGVRKNGNIRGQIATSLDRTWGVDAHTVICI